MIDLHKASKSELANFIEECFAGKAQEIFDVARKTREQYFGNEVFLRGLVEISSYCHNDCLYCGIRVSNSKAHRYRLSNEEIYDCCQNGYDLGLRTFVLQGGEDGYYTDERLCDIIRTLKDKYHDAAITLSLGERSCESYERLYVAGADRYLLRHETANEEHYSKLHPLSLTLTKRQKCLVTLKEIGYQTGAGMMIGSPEQEVEYLAEDLMFLRELKPQMVGIGPFIPHQDTPFAKQKAGGFHQTLCMIALARILLPKALLPATTALGSIAKDGLEQGLLAGANVIMPNLSPVQYREAYSLYDGKMHGESEVAEKLTVLDKRLKTIDMEINMSRGDYKEDTNGIENHKR